MFLHEPGEENDSFTRQDLSMMNSIQTQQTNQSPANAAPPPHRGPAVAAAAAPMNRQDSSDAHSPTGDAPGLPATANWGSKAAQERRASRSTNASHPSPMVTNAVPVQPPKAAKAEEAPKKKEKAKDKEKENAKGREKEKEKGKEKDRGKGKEKEKENDETTKSSTPAPAEPEPSPSRLPQSYRSNLDGLLKAFLNANFSFSFCSNALSPEDLKAVQEFPQLFEIDGAMRRREAKEAAAKEKAKALEAEREAEAKVAQEAAAQAAAAQPAAAPPEPEETNETTAGGSLQLGGEPEERHESGSGHGNRNAIAPPGQSNLGAGIFAQNASLADDFTNLALNNRALTPQQQQQQQMLLSSLKSGTAQSAGLQSNFGPQSHVAPGHARHTSRFSFANDTASASASVQPVANQKLMNQQSAMMPKNAGPFNQMSQHQPLASQFYTSGVQGPPPGLKATGTPPVSGGGMFAQGHGFATGGLGYGTNTAGRANNGDPIYQDLLRGRNLEGARHTDAGKRESMFPTFLNHPTTSTPGPTPGVLTFPYGPSPGAYQESGTQKSKKKGKKHRHGNTSSSGGAVVDVQDPSILQARLHQGGGMVNQGLYGGQGQGGFSSLYANNYGRAGQQW